MQFTGSLRLLCLAVFLLNIIHCAGASDPLFQVRIDVSKAPECESFAGKSKTIVEEWYPKINEILFGAGHPLQTDSIVLVFQPMKPIAYTDISKNKIYISAAHVTGPQPEDYGMVVHELTHVVQHYAKLKKEDVWIQEGIADYIRHQYFEQDMEKLAVDPDKDSYRTGYRPTAVFLAWLQKRKDATIIQDLNRGCVEGHCDAHLFSRFCGADVEALWKEFAAEVKKQKAALP